MKKSLPLAILLLCTCVCSANAQDDYRRWYQNLTNGIDTVTAQALVSFTPTGGTWQTHYLGSDVTWKLDASTVGTVRFNYKGGVLEDGSVVFNKPIHLRISRNGQCLAIAVKSIQYTQLGNIDFNGVKFTYESPTQCRSQLSAWLYLHLQLSQTPDALFRGQPFASSRNVTASGGQSTPLIWRVQFFPDVDANNNPMPAISVVLRKNAQFTLSGNDKWTLEEGSFRFNRLEYNVEPNVAFGRLDQFRVKIFSGSLHAGETVLTFAKNDIVEFENVEFATDSQSVTLNNGTLRNISLSDGSSIAIANGAAGKSFIEFGTGTTASLNGINASFTSGGSQAVSVDTGTIDLVVRNGALHFSPTNYVSLGQGAAHFEINSASWAAGTSPNLKARVTSFSTALGDSAIQLDDKSILRISGGSIASQSLVVNTDNDKAPITGSLSDARFTVGNGTILERPGDYQIVASGGTATAATQQTPLILDGDGNVAGKVTVSLAVERGAIRLSSVGTAYAVGGTVAGETAVIPGQPLQISPSMNLRLGPSTFLIDGVNSLNVTSGSLQAKQVTLVPGSGFKGDLQKLDLVLGSGRIRQDGSFDFTISDGGTFQVDSTTSPWTFGTGAKPLGQYLIHVPIQQGVIQLGSVGQVKVVGDFVDLRITSVAGQLITGSVGLSIRANGGDLKLNNGTKLALNSGLVKADKLVFKAGEGLTGPFTSVSLNFGPSTILFPDGFSITTLNSASFSAKDSSSPLRIATGGRVVAGRFSILADMDRLVNAANRAFELSGGKVGLELENFENGSVSSPSNASSYVRDAVFHVTSPESGRIRLSVDFNNVKLTAGPGQLTNVKGDLSGRLEDFSLHIVTTPQAGIVEPNGTRHDDARLFALTFDVEEDPQNPTTFSIPKFEWSGSSLQTPFNFPLKLLLKVPPGEGEHPNSDINEHGNHGGPDEYKSAQEVFTDTFPACRLHIYLLEKTYRVTATLDFSNTGTQQQVQIKDISMDPIKKGEGWGRDGCDSFLLKATIGVVATVVLGPIVGPLATVLLVNWAEDRLDNLVEAHMVGYIQGRRFVWAAP